MNLLKLAVGIKSIDELRERQIFNANKYKKNIHITRLYPQKHEIIKNQGSMFWIINGYISARQKIIDFNKVEHDDGKLYCHILLDKNIIVYLLCKVMRNRSLMSFSVDTIDKMYNDEKVNYFKELETFMENQKMLTL